MKKAKTKLHIAMLGHKRIPSREGGIEIVVEELSTRIAALGHSVTCFNRGGHHVSGKEFDNGKVSRYKGVHLVTVPILDRRGFAAMTSSIFASLRGALGKYDVVHFHAKGPCAMIWLPKLLGKRCVVTYSRSGLAAKKMEGWIGVPNISIWVKRWSLNLRMRLSC